MKNFLYKVPTLLPPNAPELISLGVSLPDHTFVLVYYCAKLSQYLPIIIIPSCAPKEAQSVLCFAYEIEALGCFSPRTEYGNIALIRARLPSSGLTQRRRRRCPLLCCGISGRAPRKDTRIHRLVDQMKGQ